MFLSINIIVILVSGTFARQWTQHWTYEDQIHWGRTFRSCHGSRQSPINIDTNNVIINPYLNLNLIDYDKPKKDTIANNNGRTVRITLNERSTRPQITGSAANGSFTFEELHFHWGDNDFDGSEHSVDNIGGSSELHLIHYNNKYGSLYYSRDRSDGIVILSVLLQIAQNDNIALQPIINSLPYVEVYNSITKIRELLLLDDLLPLDKKLFYRYKGSFTTPPCTESVTFIVFANPIKISQFQLSQFRRLYEYQYREPKSRITSNTRERQPKNDRIVESSPPFAGFETNEEE